MRTRSNPSPSSRVDLASFFPYLEMSVTVFTWFFFLFISRPTLPWSATIHCHPFLFDFDYEKLPSNEIDYFHSYFCQFVGWLHNFWAAAFLRLILQFFSFFKIEGVFQCFLGFMLLLSLHFSVTRLAYNASSRVFIQSFLLLVCTSSLSNFEILFLCYFYSISFLLFWNSSNCRACLWARIPLANGFFFCPYIFPWLCVE